MLSLTPETAEAMAKLSKGHLAIFLYERPFELNGTGHIAAITMMIRQDDTVYYRCIIDECKVVDVEKLKHGAVAGWVELQFGMTGLSRTLGAIVESRNIL